MNVLPFVRRTVSREVPVLSRPLAEKLSGSVVGATELDVQCAAIAANPMRLLVRQGCGRCHHEWQAPVQGLCPRCSGGSFFIEELPCMAVRL